MQPSRLNIEQGLRVDNFQPHKAVGQTNGNNVAGDNQRRQRITLWAVRPFVQYHTKFGLSAYHALPRGHRKLATPSSLSMGVAM